MLYHLLEPLKDQFGLFNLFSYRFICCFCIFLLSNNIYFFFNNYDRLRSFYLCFC